MGAVNRESDKEAYCRHENQHHSAVNPILAILP